MPQRSYDWIRYWTSNRQAITLDDAYLADPAAFPGAQHADLRSTDALRNVNAAVLAAEPGLGKSTEITRLEDTCLKQGDKVVSLDLATFADVQDVRSSLSDALETSDWARSESGERLTLLLDGLDELTTILPNAGAVLSEALGRVLGQAEFTTAEFEALCASCSGLETLLAGLIRKLDGQVRVDWNKLRTIHTRVKLIPNEIMAKLHAALRAQRLQLFISCRTAEWPQQLGETLAALWGKAWHELELTPLRREDVRMAAQAEELSPEDFFQKVGQAGAHALAARPITLRFLLNSIQNDTGAPLTQLALYEAGCRHLCEELNERRLDAELTGRLSAAQRLTVAKRVAALGIFGQRPTLLTRPTVHPSAADLLLSDIEGGEEGQAGSLVAVTAQAVKEVARTALFTSGGEGRQSWAHRTYAEYLAARYLIDADLTDRQILNLITQPGDPRQRVAAPLRNVGSWLSVLRPALGRSLARRDPLSLMTSGALPVDDEDKKLILEAYLEHENDDSLPYDRAYSQRFSLYRHPDIAAQLRPWITDPSRTPRVRYLATRIAEATQAEALWPELTQVALDDTVPTMVREGAAAAAATLLPEAEHLRLKPLLAGPTDDDLRGWALEALWPGQLSIGELLTALKEPTKRGHTGAYQHFLSRETLWTSVPDGDLLQVITWLGEPEGGAWLLPSTPYAEIEGRRYRRRLLLRLWDALDTPEMLAAFSALFAPQFMSHAGLEIVDGKTDRLQTDAARRQQLILTLVNLPEKNGERLWLLRSNHPLVRPEDASWILDRYDHTPVEEQPFWKTLVTWLFHTEQMQTAIANHVLSDDLQLYVRSLMPDPNAPKPEWLAKHEQMALEERTRRDALPKFDQQIEEALKEMQAGDAKAWWIIPHRLHVNDDKVAIDGDMQPDLRQHNGWSLLDEATQDRITNGAKAFLLQTELEPKRQSYGYSRSGMLALRLLQEVAPAFIDTLPSKAWEHWTSGLIDHAPLNASATEVDHRLWQQAYRAAPTVFLQKVEQEIEQQDDPFHARPVIRMLSRLIDKPMEALLLGLVRRSPALHAETIAELLHILLNADSADGRGEAVRLLRAYATDRPLAVASALTLTSQTGDTGWPELWPEIQADKSFGRDVVTALAARAPYTTPDLTDRLSDAQLGALYQWVEEQYPEADDPVRPTGFVYTPAARDELGTWRTGLLNTLSDRGTEGALNELKRLETALPQVSVTLRRAYAFAEERYLQQACLPVAPADLLELTRSKRAVLVRDAAQLQEVVIDTLQLLQGELQGENSAAPALWNIYPDGKAAPKDEEALSDHVARFLRNELEHRGVVLSREVQIRRKVGAGGAMGEEIDIYISAVTQHVYGRPFETVSVIVEVKGSWNKDLKTSLEKQLAKRYLADNDVRHGIYLVGWPLCAQWDKGDSKYKKTPKWSLDDAKTFFNQQAEDVSRREGVTIRSVVLDMTLR